MGSLQESLALLREDQQKEVARVLDQFVNPDDSVQVITQALDTAQDISAPFEISGFMSIYVATATDSATNVNIRINSKAMNVGSIPLTRKDSISQDYPCARAYLHWAAQTGKSITLILFRHAKFQSGSQISVINGGVTQSTGDTVSRAVVTLSAATGAALFAQSSTRKCGTCVNTSGADLWIGEANTITNSGGTLGLYVAPGEKIVWQNTAALYAYSVAGCSLVTLTES